MRVDGVAGALANDYDDRRTEIIQSAVPYEDYMIFTQTEVARMMDFSAVRADCDLDDIRFMVEKARQYNPIAVFALPAWTSVLCDMLGGGSEIKVGGVTSVEASTALADALGKYLKDVPTVTISVLQLAGNKIFVLGKVNRPGEFPINRPTDVMQALAMAGGLNTFASENGINILRVDD